MNILLTGESGVGKSEIIKRVLARTGVNAGGMLTEFVNREREDRQLFMMDLQREVSHEAVSFNFGDSPTVNMDVFNGFGSELIGKSKEYDLAIVDELGNFENNADKFKDAVLGLLTDEIDVLGVIKSDYRGWLNDIRARNDVNIITVTMENREEMPGYIIGLLGLVQ